MKKCLLTAILLAGFFMQSRGQQTGQRININMIATTSGPEKETDYNRLNDGIMPVNRKVQRLSRRVVQYQAQQWVQYDFKQPVSTNAISVYWHNFNNSIRLPHAYHIEYWNGNNFEPVQNAQGYGLANDELNTTTFAEVKTDKLRIAIDSTDRGATPLQEWIVYKAHNTDQYAPIVTAGVDRDVILGGKTYLSGVIKSPDAVQVIKWSKAAGPGVVNFENAGANNRLILGAGKLCA